MLDFLVERIESLFICKMFRLQTLNLLYNKFLLKFLHIHFKVFNSCVVGLIVLLNKIKVHNLRGLIRTLIRVSRVSLSEDLSHSSQIVIKLLETLSRTYESILRSFPLFFNFSFCFYKTESHLISCILHASALLLLPDSEFSVPIVGALYSHVELHGCPKALIKLFTRIFKGLQTISHFSLSFNQVKNLFLLSGGNLLLLLIV